MTRWTRSARAARNRNSSATGDISWGNLSATLRAASATGVPPGCRTAVTWSPSVTSRAASQRTSVRSEEHTSELQSRLHLVCRLLLEKKKKKHQQQHRVDRCKLSVVHSPRCVT